MAQTMLPLTTDVIIDNHDFDEHVEEGETVYLYLKNDSNVAKENTVEARLNNGMKMGRLSSDSSETIRSKIASGIELRGKIRRVQEDKNFCNVKIYKPSFSLWKTPSTYRWDLAIFFGCIWGHTSHSPWIKHHLRVAWCHPVCMVVLAVSPHSDIIE